MLKTNKRTLFKVLAAASMAAGMSVGPGLCSHSPQEKMCNALKGHA